MKLVLLPKETIHWESSGSLAFGFKWASSKVKSRSLRFWVAGELYIRPAFLALLDYVSRAHEVEIRPSVHLWHRLSLSYCMDFFQILVVASPGQYCMPRHFLILKKKNLNLQIFFVFFNMGPYGSENFKMLLLLQIAAESFQTFP